MCEHNIQRSRCKICKGCLICEHNRIRPLCIDCKGSALCFEHHNGYTKKRHCLQCGGEYLCRSCRIWQVNKKNIICATCNKPGWQGKVKEKAVGLKLLEWASEKKIPLFTCADKALPGTGTRYRMDFYYDLGHFSLAVECDEAEHALKGYPPRCELVRMYNIRKTLEVPAIFVRWNPDSFKINGDTMRVSQARRFELLKDTLQYYIKEGPAQNFMVVVTICYSQPVETMHGERLPYVTTQQFPSELEYETFVGNVYPNDCNSTTSKIDWFMKD